MKKGLKQFLIVLVIGISILSLADMVVAPQGASSGQSSGQSSGSSRGGDSGRDSGGVNSGSLRDSIDSSLGMHSDTLGSATEGLGLDLGGRIDSSGRDSGTSGVSSGSDSSGGRGTTGIGTTSCFPANTLISTPNGPIKIKDIQKGDLIYSVDLETNEVVIDKVKKLIIHDGINEFKHDYSQVPLMEVCFSNDICLDVTANHPFYYIQKEKWDNILNIPEGEKVYFADENVEEVEVIGKRFLKETPVVYNFETKKHHNYLAEGFLVHNEGGGSLFGGSTTKQLVITVNGIQMPSNTIQERNL